MPAPNLPKPTPPPQVKQGGVGSTGGDQVNKNPGQNQALGQNKAQTQTQNRGQAPRPNSAPTPQSAAPASQNPVSAPQNQTPKPQNPVPTPQKGGSSQLNPNQKVGGAVQQPRPLGPQTSAKTPPSPQGGAQQTPSSNTSPTNPANPKLPPASLSALSSLSSNKLPQAGSPPAMGQIPPAQNTGSMPPGQNSATNTPSKDDQKKDEVKAPEAGRSPASGAPKFAAIKKSPLRFLPIILGAVLILGIIAFAASRFLGRDTTTSSDTTTPSVPSNPQIPSSNKKTTLVYWGLWEPSGVMEEVLKDFEAQNPDYQVQYSKQSHKDYRERLQSAIATGQGPDVFRFHATWVPMLRQELAPLPSSVMSAQEYQSTFYPAAARMLQSDGKIVGIPLMYDGLALLYNTEIFKTAGIEPPTTWADLQSAAAKLTIKADGQIKRAGIAIGNSTNVDHFADIVALLMLQNGADFQNPNSAEARDALVFYTNFQKQYGIWDETLPPSTVAFSRGDAAMVFAPSWRIHEIKASNPELPFAVLPVPQLGDEKIAWASFWAEGVNSKGKNTEASWKLLSYLSSKPVLEKLYAAQSQIRPFGEIYPRVDMASSLASDPLVGAYVLDAPYAYSWYLSTSTHDNGLNDQLVKYYEDAITAIVEGKGVNDVLGTLEQGTRTVVRQYSSQ